MTLLGRIEGIDADVAEIEEECSATSVRWLRYVGRWVKPELLIWTLRLAS